MFKVTFAYHGLIHSMDTLGGYLRTTTPPITHEREHSVPTEKGARSLAGRYLAELKRTPGKVTVAQRGNCTYVSDLWEGLHNLCSVSVTEVNTNARH